MKKVFLLRNEDGQVVHAFSTLKRAFQFAVDHNFRLDYRALNDVIEIEVNGDSWGIHHSFDEIEEVLTLSSDS